METYVIEVGNYSDKKVIGTASSKERAEEIVKNMRTFYKKADCWYYDEDFNITKFILDALPNYVEQTIFDVSYFSHEDDWCCDQVTDNYFDDSAINEVVTWNTTTKSPTISKPAYRVLVAADNKKTALKAGTEHILQYIAKEVPSQLSPTLVGDL
jgi:hypothetical protein